MSDSEQRDAGSDGSYGGLIHINPEDLGAPRGYSHGTLTPMGSRILFIAGQVGWDREQHLVGENFVAQFEQALANVVLVVRSAGGGRRDIARLTIYVTDKTEYLADLVAIGEVYRRVMGRHFPAMALVEVAGLVEPGAKVEIEGTAAIS
jgi:enamine deaminase RidA (YjgF/YER057c/UK114 family)